MPSVPELRIKSCVVLTGRERFNGWYYWVNQTNGAYEAEKFSSQSQIDIMNLTSWNFLVLRPTSCPHYHAWAIPLLASYIML